MHALRRVYIVYEDRDDWITRKRRATNVPGLEEMAHFLFGQADISEVADDIRKQLAHTQTDLSVIRVDQTIGLSSLEEPERSTSLVWNITDGSGPFSGSHVPSFARLIGIKCFGNSTFNQILSQDKFKTGLVCRELGVPVPPSILTEGSNILAGTPSCLRGEMFIKPCTLDNKIGIFSDSKVTRLEDAMAVSDRIYELYGDRAVIQTYVPGRDIRVSFLNVNLEMELRNAIGIYWSQERSLKEGPYSSYTSHLRSFLSWDAKSTSGLSEDAREDTRMQESLESIITSAGKIVRGLQLRDYYAFDFRIDEKGGVWLMEVNTAPFLRNRGMRDFIQKRHGLTFAAGVAAALHNSFRRQSRGVAMEHL